MLNEPMQANAPRLSKKTCKRGFVCLDVPCMSTNPKLGYCSSVCEYFLICSPLQEPFGRKRTSCLGRPLGSDGVRVTVPQGDIDRPWPRVSSRPRVHQAVAGLSVAQWRGCSLSTTKQQRFSRSLFLDSQKWVFQVDRVP